MKLLIVFSALVAVAFGRPGVLLANTNPHLIGAVSYARLVPGAPIGLDGRVVDTPEVVVAKAEHAAAHLNERINLANEAVKSADFLSYSAPVVATGAQLVGQPLAIATKIVPGAPIGLDGRVVDTAEVALAKAEHAAAHVNEKIGLAHEAARSASYESPVVVSAYSAPLIQQYHYV